MTKFTKIIHSRVFIFTILLLILCSLFVYYYDNFQLHQEYPTEGTIIKSYPTSQIFIISGTVTETFPGGFYLEDTYSDVQKNYTIYSKQNVNTGDLVQVSGLRLSQNVVNAEQVIRTPFWTYLFVIVRSFMAFLFLAFIFNRYWMFNWKNLVFHRRTRPKRYFHRRK